MSSRAVTQLGYAAIAAAVIAWQVSCALRHSVTLGRLARTLLNRQTIRVLALLGWAWWGWHLFVRGSGAFRR